MNTFTPFGFIVAGAHPSDHRRSLLRCSFMPRPPSSLWLRQALWLIIANRGDDTPSLYAFEELFNKFYRHLIPQFSTKVNCKPGMARAFRRTACPENMRKCADEKKRTTDESVMRLCWRRGPESNRARRICNPLHRRFTPAYYLMNQGALCSSPFFNRGV